MTFFKFFELGGPLIWPIVILGIVAIVVFIERVIYLHKGQIKVNLFIDGIKNLLRNDRLLEALTLCEETPGPIARIVKVALLNHEAEERLLALSIQRTAIVEIPFLERRISTLNAISITAPLFGLIGTLVNMLYGFFKSQELAAVYASASHFVQYLSAALITSILGLIIAGLGYLSYYFLLRRMHSIIHDMEWASNEMISFLAYELRKV